MKDRLNSPEDPRYDPSFDQIALAIVQRVWAINELDQPGLLIETSAVADRLRQVWNARGAADLAAVNEIAHTNWENIESALRNLDR